MLFAKKDTQYRTPGKVICRRIEALAKKYNAELSLHPCWGGASYYGDLEPNFESDTACTLEVRVSRHSSNPNNGCAAIDIRVGDEWCEVAENFCQAIESAWEIERPAEVEKYLAALEKRAEAKAAKLATIKAEAAARAEIENQKRTEMLKAARIENLRKRCAMHKITPDMVRDAMNAPQNDDPSCIASQIKAWFQGFDADEAAAIIQ